MTRKTTQKDRRFWRLAGPSTEDRSSQADKRHCTGSVPPHTPPAIARALVRLLRRADDLADLGANVSISVAYIGTRDELTGLLIADEQTAALAARVLSPGVYIFEAGRRAEA